ncbi:MAG: hypothetical protein ACAI44_03390 [Candidatus Sericytochromatia bacterium]
MSDNSIRLNQNVFKAVEKAVKDDGTISAKEWQTIQKAIVKDDMIDSSEMELLQAMQSQASFAVQNDKGVGYVVEANQVEFRMGDLEEGTAVLLNGELKNIDPLSLAASHSKITAGRFNQELWVKAAQGDKGALRQVEDFTNRLESQLKKALKGFPEDAGRQLDASPNVKALRDALSALQRLNFKGGDIEKQLDNLQGTLAGIKHRYRSSYNDAGTQAKETEKVSLDAIMGNLTKAFKVNLDQLKPPEEILLADTVAAVEKLLDNTKVNEALSAFAHDPTNPAPVVQLKAQVQAAAEQLASAAAQLENQGGEAGPQLKQALDEAAQALKAFAAADLSDPHVCLLQQEILTQALEQALGFAHDEASHPQSVFRQLESLLAQFQPLTESEELGVRVAGMEEGLAQQQETEQTQARQQEMEQVQLAYTDQRMQELGKVLDQCFALRMNGEGGKSLKVLTEAVEEFQSQLHFLIKNYDSGISQDQHPVYKVSDTLLDMLYARADGDLARAESLKATLTQQIQQIEDPLMRVKLASLADSAAGAVNAELGEETGKRSELIELAKISYNDQGVFTENKTLAQINNNSTEFAEDLSDDAAEDPAAARRLQLFQQVKKAETAIDRTTHRVIEGKFRTAIDFYSHLKNQNDLYASMLRMSAQAGIPFETYLEKAFDGDKDQIKAIKSLRERRAALGNDDPGRAEIQRSINGYIESLIDETLEELRDELEDVKNQANPYALLDSYPNARAEIYAELGFKSPMVKKSLENVMAESSYPPVVDQSDLQDMIGRGEVTNPKEIVFLTQLEDYDDDDALNSTMLDVLDFVGSAALSAVSFGAGAAYTIAKGVAKGVVAGDKYGEGRAGYLAGLRSGEELNQLDDGRNVGGIIAETAISLVLDKIDIPGKAFKWLGNKLVLDGPVLDKIFKEAFESVASKAGQEVSSQAVQELTASLVAKKMLDVLKAQFKPAEFSKILSALTPDTLVLGYVGSKVSGEAMDALKSAVLGEAAKQVQAEAKTNVEAVVLQDAIQMVAKSVRVPANAVSIQDGKLSFDSQKIDLAMAAAKQALAREAGPDISAEAIDKAAARLVLTKLFEAIRPDIPEADWAGFLAKIQTEGLNLNASPANDLLKAALPGVVGMFEAEIQAKLNAAAEARRQQFIQKMERPGNSHPSFKGGT